MTSVQNNCSDLDKGMGSVVCPHPSGNRGIADPTHNILPFLLQPFCASGKQHVPGKTQVWVNAKQTQYIHTMQGAVPINYSYLEQIYHVYCTYFVTEAKKSNFVCGLP